MAPMGIRPRATQRIRLPDSSPHRCMQIHTYYRIFSLILSLSPRGHSPLSPIYTHCCNLSVPLSSLTSTIPSSLILSSFHAYLNINDQPVTIFLLYLTSSSSSIHSNAFIIVPFSSNSSYVSSQYSLILLYFSLSMFLDRPTLLLLFFCLSVYFFLSLPMSTMCRCDSFPSIFSHSECVYLGRRGGVEVLERSRG